MPYTVATSIDRFLTNISLRGSHEATAEARRKHLVELLERKLEILDTISTGSIVHDTGLIGAADLDIIAVLHYGKHIKDRTPKAVLQSVRDCLGDASAIVKKNGQAVTLYYKSWPNVDVVPASRIKNNDGSISHYDIPDMDRGVWIETRPRTHNNAMAAASARRRALIRMVKTWNRAHSELMQSFHISVLVLTLPEITQSWPYEIMYFFEKAVAAIDDPIYHPGGKTTRADSYLDTATRREIKERLRSAHSWAAGAFSAIARQDEREAIRLYGLLFGGKFPAYG